MLKNKFALLFASSFILSALFNIFPQPALSDVQRVSDRLCKDREDFFKLWNGTTEANGVCFANPGTMRVTIFNVVAVDSGNNYGLVKYRVANQMFEVRLCHKNYHEGIAYHPENIVYSVTLSATPPRGC